MTDQDFMAAFEDTSLNANLFNHEAHIRMGWIYATRYPLADAIDRFARALKAYTEALGCADKYHETITWFYMLLIAERQAETQATSFDAFLAANPDLVATPSILTRYYSQDTLASARARQHYILPDRGTRQEAA
ncbi:MULTISPECIES: hypothetical protein [Kordiimonas]|jgi:hypothetical protein|uniref:hypothetical protein n=1 Tax=Kordiimonas TaxID=288021 RepID=UPI00257BE166|nr:hypothetical protein [Kordiimonas sp. UBA4487]